jgi:folate-dependent phosphoribosylglycinamide formyltransferase PurN
MSIPVVAIVGNQLRHRWFVGDLARDERLDLRGVVVERQPAPRQGETEAESALIADHFAERAAAEERYFGGASAWEDSAPAVREVERGGPNTDDVAAWVERLAPEQLVLYGCGILRAPLLDRFEGRTVNMHLGLSPYYIGHATNFWPLVNGEPECVGATIHLATLSVDAGPILVQARPEPAADDGPHDLGCKTIRAGAAALRERLAAHAEGRADAVPQGPAGRVYRHADFNAGAVAELRRRFAAGMIPAYIADKRDRDGRFPIVE